ncbi:hypothetical protein JCM8097_005309 [Rhodosporidiobolus ruineniae]
MLGRLPVELLIPILRQLAPLAYSPVSYKQRRADLRSCCLVSRTFRVLAQPLLEEVFAVDTVEDADDLAVVVDGAKRGSKVRLLVLVGEETGPLDNWVALENLTKVCPNVVDLRIRHAREFRLDWLAGMPNLRHLVVSNCTLFPPADTTFPSLIELSICDADVPSTFLDTSSIASTPHLVAMGLSYVRPTEVGPQRFCELSQPILDRLEALSLDSMDDAWALRARVTAPPPPPAPSLILDVCLSRLSEATEGGAKYPARAVRLYLAVINIGPEAVQFRLVKNIATFRCYFLVPPLKLVILPHKLKRGALSADLVAEVDKMLAVAAQKGIEVIWEDEPDYEYESLVSPAFWRRRREERARTGVKAGEA